MVTLTEATFRNEIHGSDVPLVVDFYADGCEPCRQLAPIMEELSRKYQPRVRFDNARELADSYRIGSIPAGPVPLRRPRGALHRGEAGRPAGAGSGTGRHLAAIAAGGGRPGHPSPDQDYPRASARKAAAVPSPYPRCALRSLPRVFASYSHIGL